MGLSKNGCILLKFYHKSKILAENNLYSQSSYQVCSYNSPEIVERRVIDFKYDIWCVGWFLKALTCRDSYNDLNRVADFNHWTNRPLELANLFINDLQKLFTW